VVTEGTARGVFDAIPVEVAGKTGTAQTDEGDKEPHSWFTGFTPVSKPQYAFACVIENGGYGKQGAAPAVRDWLLKEFGGK
jgi:cell division protein FtsI/penicillin-binding protein 2